MCVWMETSYKVKCSKQCESNVLLTNSSHYISLHKNKVKNEKVECSSNGRTRVWPTLCVGHIQGGLRWFFMVSCSCQLMRGPVDGQRLRWMMEIRVEMNRCGWSTMCMAHLFMQCSLLKVPRGTSQSHDQRIYNSDHIAAEAKLIVLLYIYYVFILRTDTYSGPGDQSPSLKQPAFYQDFKI